MCTVVAAHNVSRLASCSFWHRLQNKDSVVFPRTFQFGCESYLSKMCVDKRKKEEEERCREKEMGREESCEPALSHVHGTTRRR